MARTLPIRFNDEEEKTMLKALEASDDRSMGAHIKRVYFEALKPNLAVLEGVRDEIRSLHSALGDMRGQTSKTDDSLALSILCGLYVMVRESIPATTKMRMDKVLDVKAIEAYLKGE